MHPVILGAAVAGGIAFYKFVIKPVANGIKDIWEENEKKQQKFMEELVYNLEIT